MSNRLLTREEVSKQIEELFTQVCDEHQIPEKDRARLLLAAFRPLMDSPMPGYEP